MAGKAAAGVGGFFKNLVVGLLLLGFGLAVLSIFKGDPFAFFTWCWNTCSAIVFAIRDWLLSIDTFHKLFTG